MESSWKKILGWLIALLMAVTGVFLGESATDDPYVDTGDSYVLTTQSSDSDGGAIETELSKEEPSLTFSKWDGDAVLKMQYGAGVGSDHLFGSAVSWESGLEVRPLPATTNTDGGFEMTITVDSRPPSNRFQFFFEGYQDFDFFLQPPLNEDPNFTQYNCTETMCTDDEGEMIAERTKDVIGSYAIYHKSLKDHETGKVNYATGKFAHIFRPLVTDADGHQVFGDLEYRDGTLTIIVPQEFLDTATYPVKI